MDKNGLQRLLDRNMIRVCMLLLSTLIMTVPSHQQGGHCHHHLCCPDQWLESFQGAGVNIERCQVVHVTEVGHL